MSHIDVHEIKLNLRYPNSRQEDITDAFMRGYQGAVKIGNDAVRRVKAEKAALERRIDELCAEVEYDRQTSRSRLERIDQLKDENAKLRELVDELYPLADYGAMDASELDRAHDLMRDVGIEVPS